MKSNTSKARSRSKVAVMQRHILPLDGETVERLERLEIKPLGDAVAKLTLLITAAGWSEFGYSRMREIDNGARMHRDGDEVMITPMKSASGKVAFVYADIDGVAGAVLAELAKVWKCAREDVLERCIPKSKSGLQFLVDDFDKGRRTAAGCRRNARRARG